MESEKSKKKVVDLACKSKFFYFFKWSTSTAKQAEMLLFSVLEMLGQAAQVHSSKVHFSWCYIGYMDI